MTNTTTPSKTEKVKISPEDQKHIDAHKKIAADLQTASKLHLDAAKQHEEGNSQNALMCSTDAKNRTELILEAQKEIAKADAMKKNKH